MWKKGRKHYFFFLLFSCGKREENTIFFYFRVEKGKKTIMLNILSISVIKNKNSKDQLNQKKVSIETKVNTPTREKKTNVR